jgi:hypothetical protein
MDKTVEGEKEGGYISAPHADVMQCFYIVDYITYV